MEGLGGHSGQADRFPKKRQREKSLLQNLFTNGKSAGKKTKCFANKRRKRKVSKPVTTHPYDGFGLERKRVGL